MCTESGGDDLVRSREFVDMNVDDLSNFTVNILEKRSCPSEIENDWHDFALRRRLSSPCTWKIGAFGPRRTGCSKYQCETAPVQATRLIVLSKIGMRRPKRLWWRKQCHALQMDVTCGSNMGQWQKQKQLGSLALSLSSVETDEDTQMFQVCSFVCLFVFFPSFVCLFVRIKSQLICRDIRLNTAISACQDAHEVELDVCRSMEQKNDLCPFSLCLFLYLCQVLFLSCLHETRAWESQQAPTENPRCSSPSRLIPSRPHCGTSHYFVSHRSLRTQLKRTQALRMLYFRHFFILKNANTFW